MKIITEKDYLGSNGNNNFLKEISSSIIQFSKDAIIIINHSGKIILWNKAAESLLGYSVKEAVGNTLDIIIPSKMRKYHHAGMNHFIKTGEKKLIDSTTVIEAQKKDRSIIPIELSLSSWQDETEEVFISGIIRDISDRQAKERKIIDLRGIIDSSPSCLKLINRKGELLMMNSVGLELIEADNFEIVDKANVYDIVHEDDRTLFTKFNEYICSGKKGTLIFKIVGLNGTERIMETFAQHHQLESGEIAHIAITNEITERVKTEQKLKQKDQEIEMANRLSVIGEFAAGIAHEVNNPLAVIHSKAELLEMQLDTIIPDKTSNYENILQSIESIKKTTTHTADLIKNLRTFSSKASFKNMGLVKLSEITSMVLKTTEMRCRDAGIKIILEFNTEIKLKCNPSALSQVILNLISNSIHAIELFEGSKWIKIESEATDSLLKIYITDSGQGISEKVAKKILTPFYSTKDPGKGTGLGLSISRKLLDKMDGKIYYNSQCENTQFVLEFKSFEQ